MDFKHHQILDDKISKYMINKLKEIYEVMLLGDNNLENDPSSAIKHYKKAQELLEGGTNGDLWCRLAHANIKLGKLTNEKKFFYNAESCYINAIRDYENSKTIIEGNVAELRKLINIGDDEEGFFPFPLVFKPPND
jgi:hypothetical protein